MLVFKPNFLLIFFFFFFFLKSCLALFSGFFSVEKEFNTAAEKLWKTGKL